MPFWTYMLHCADSTFYVGQTDNLEKRIGEHEQGLIPGYTSTRRPAKLVWSREFGTREEARFTEERLKGWSRPKKMALIRGDWTAIAQLARGRQEEKASTSSAKSVFETLLYPNTTHLPSQPFNFETDFRLDEGGMRLRYRLTGPIDILAIPAASSIERKDNLWHHTCFEAFVKFGGGDDYLEFNFAPSSQWAAYRFEAYRAGGTELALETPRIRVTRTRYALELTAALDLPQTITPTRIALSAVIEENSGHKSYWALAHPPGPPDFHHPDCFALELPPPASE